MLRLPFRRNLVHRPCITFGLELRQISHLSFRAQTKVSSRPIFSNALRSQSASLASQTPPRSVGYWLLSCSALVFGIIVVGGVTRLTESGLSITEWKPITGVAFPRTTEQWQEEFDKYSRSPEFKMFVNACPISVFEAYLS